MHPLFWLVAAQPVLATQGVVTLSGSEWAALAPPETPDPRWQSATAQLAAHPPNHDDDSPNLPRHIPDDTARRVRRRAGYACEAPDCDSTHALEAHHIVFFANNPDHSDDNLTLLCSPCHKARHRTIHLQQHPSPS